MGADDDWREHFLRAKPSRIIMWKGTLYAKAATTQLHRFYIREAELQTLARVTYKWTRCRR